jgi:hypothetical protein
MTIMIMKIFDHITVLIVVIVIVPPATQTGYRKVVGDTCEGGWQPQQASRCRLKRGDAAVAPLRI